jgi:hypothetical protein
MMLFVEKGKGTEGRRRGSRELGFLLGLVRRRGKWCGAGGEEAQSSSCCSSRAGRWRHMSISFGLGKSLGFFSFAIIYKASLLFVWR